MKGNERKDATMAKEVEPWVAAGAQSGNNASIGNNFPSKPQVPNTIREREGLIGASSSSSKAPMGEPHRSTTSTTGTTSSFNANTKLAAATTVMDDIITRLSATDEEEDGYSSDERTKNDEKQPLLSGTASHIARRSAVSHRSSQNTASRSFTNQPTTGAMGSGGNKNNNNNNDAGLDRTKRGSSDQAVCVTGSYHSAFIYLVTFLSAIGGFLFGYDTGIVSGSMVFIRDYFNLNHLWQEIVVSATILAAWLFSIVAGYLTDAFGRKWIILLASFIFTIGGFMMAFAESKLLLVGGRFTVGAAIGLASMAIPVYIAEVAPVQIRGKLVTINTCFITFGQFVASVLAGIFSNDPEYGWRWMLGLASVPSIIQLVCFAFMPESPRWLIQKRHYEDALKSLSKFRSNSTPEEIDREFQNIKNNCLQTQELQETVNVRQILATPYIRRALIVGCLLMAFQQLAGINTVMYYSATIIQMSGVNDKSTAVWLSALTSLINFVFSFVGIFLVERLGRRPLILTSLIGVVFSLLTLGAGSQLAEVYSPPISFHTANQSICTAMTTCQQCISSHCGFCFYDATNNFLSQPATQNANLNGTCLMIDDVHHIPSNGTAYCATNTDDMMLATQFCPSNYAWITLAGLMMYLFFFAPGMGPMPWTINSEIFPLYARSTCYSISTSINWFFNLLVSLTFLSLTEELETYGTYYLYAGVAALGWLLFFLLLPETKGRSLEQISSLFERSLFAARKAKIEPYSQVTNVGNGSSATSSTNSSQSSINTQSTASSQA